MAVPISQMWTVATYVLKKRLKGSKRYPLVLMLEPLFRCNLACAGCGKVQYPPHILKKQLTPEQCFRRRRRMRRAHGLHPRRRAAAASADRRDRQRPRRAQEVHLPLHQRARAQAPPAGVHAVEVPHLLRASRRPARGPRLLRLPRGRLGHRRRRHQGGRQARLPRHAQLHLLRRHRPQSRPRPL